MELQEAWGPRDFPRVSIHSANMSHQRELLLGKEQTINQLKIVMIDPSFPSEKNRKSPSALPETLAGGGHGAGVWGADTSCGGPVALDSLPGPLKDPARAPWGDSD